MVHINSYEVPILIYVEKIIKYEKMHIQVNQVFVYSDGGYLPYTTECV